MRVVETIQLKKTKELSSLCHKTKNLYNLGLYYINNYYDVLDQYITWYDTNWMLKGNKAFKALPSQVSQYVLKMLHENWIGYFNANKDFKKHPDKYQRMPQPPNYLRKNGEFPAVFTYNAARIKNDKKLYFAKSCLPSIKEVETTNDEFQQARIIPRNGYYNLEVVYERPECDLHLDKTRIIGIDIGVDNLVCVTNNINLRPFSINGRPLKAINHFYNKRKAELKSVNDVQNESRKKRGLLPQYTTKRLDRLERIRENKIKDYTHKAARYIINYCIENNIGTIVIGHNPLWKKKINLGKETNQKFVQIPFNKLISYLEYKAQLVGIQIIEITEEYTSKCSFLDREEMKYHDKYAGKRVSRGLFRASDGRLINADVNASYNIIKKAFPKAINADGIQGAQLHPLIVNLDTKSKAMVIKPTINTNKVVWHPRVHG